MSTSALVVSYVLGLGTIAGQLFGLVLVAAVLFPSVRMLRILRTEVARFALVLGFLLAMGAFAASLFYSDVIGFEPCSLCWWQRIFIYPQVLILGLGMWLRDHRALVYTFALSLVGGLIALYHTYIQYGGSPIFKCGVDAASCAQRFVYVFDYVTIPLMSLTIFVLLGFISFLGLRQR